MTRRKNQANGADQDSQQKKGNSPSRRQSSKPKSRSKQANPNPADSVVDRGSAAEFQRQSRQISKEIPGDDQQSQGNLGGSSQRSFSELDADERSDTNRRVGKVYQGTGESKDPAEIDEDGGGPLQGNQTEIAEQQDETEQEVSAEDQAAKRNVSRRDVSRMK